MALKSSGDGVVLAGDLYLATRGSPGRSRFRGDPGRRTMVVAAARADTREVMVGEVGRINVYAPAAHDGHSGRGLNGTMRPFLLVGIENTQRRRDLTGPTSIAADSAVAIRVGGSAAFRRFLREELMPAVRERYHTTDESALLGESLAALFVVEPATSRG